MLVVVAATSVAFGLVSTNGVRAYVIGAVASGGSLLLVAIGADRSARNVTPSRR